MATPTRKTLDAIVSAFDAPMIVVTTEVDGVRDGCLVGFHAQTSIEPFRYTVWLSKANATTRLAKRASHLVIHVLERDHHHLAERFGADTLDDGVDKFAGVPTVRSPAGVPRLREVPSWFEGLVVARHHRDGDHVAHVLEPTASCRSAPTTMPVLRLRHIRFGAGHPEPH